MRARLLSPLLGPNTSPLASGLVVAASLIAAETLLVYLLKQVAPHSVFGVVYLIGVLVVSTGWGFGLAATTSVANAFAFNYFRIQPGESIIPTEAEDAAVIIIFLAVALLANTLAYLVRSRAAEADQRRRDFDLAAERAALKALGRRSTSRSNSTSLSSGGCPRLPKWPRITLSQRHSPTWPSTHKRLK